MFGPDDAFVLDDGRVRQALQEHDLLAQLRHLILRAPVEGDTLHGDDLTSVEVEGSVD